MPKLENFLNYKAKIYSLKKDRVSFSVEILA